MPSSVVQAALERAQERWPGVEFTRADIEPSFDAGDIGSSVLEDLLLARACARKDRRALAHFEREVMASVAGAIRRIDARATFCDDVRQLLRERLLVGDPPRIADYRGHGALVAWVNVAAMRVALNLKRDELRRDRRPLDDDWVLAIEIADTADVELESLKARYREAFGQAIRAACRDLSERERTILRAQLVDGYGIDKFAGLFGVHRSTAARWVRGAQDALRRAVVDRLKGSEGLTTHDADVVARLARSQIQVSFSGLVVASDDADR